MCERIDTDIGSTFLVFTVFWFLPCDNPFVVCGGAREFRNVSRIRQPKNARVRHFQTSRIEEGRTSKLARYECLGAVFQYFAQTKNLEIVKSTSLKSHWFRTDLIMLSTSNLICTVLSYKLRRAMRVRTAYLTRNSETLLGLAE